ncbi:tyrosine-type recombinase/integrase [Pseudooceanicola sp. MF1-13]|uniref:tyrosine-type recombinase/integrase n=1 Tax=Pseudooceanicola sp. MF1-13 TaxID=3379095 RepID=UPI003891F00A
MPKKVSKPAMSLAGIHRVTKKLKSGPKTYHYACRGGPLFWSSDMEIVEGSEAYFQALAAATAKIPTAVIPNRDLTKAVVDRFIVSPHFKALKPRTKKDYRKFLDSFAKEFGEDPIQMFEQKSSVAEILEWKNKWSDSLKQFDYAGTVVTLFLNWVKDAELSIEVHHHVGQKKLYKCNRAEIIWKPEEIQALLDVADEVEARIVVAASEGGLTPQDIGILTMSHVQRTPKGRRLYFQRTKTEASVAIPVTPEMAQLIDTTPVGQKYLVVNKTGGRLTPERASQIVRDLKKRANNAASSDKSNIHISDDLRLYDMRGTAATALLRAGCSLNEIAVTMGWGLRHASNIIEKYAALVPEVSDEVNKKLAKAKKKERKRAAKAAKKASAAL